jgi:hypothetical protein
MTQKEKLYKEYVIAKNKLNALYGKKLIGGDNIEEYFNSYDFSNRASHHTKDEIRNMIDYAKRCYESEVEKLRVENYFSTEEGKEEKEKLTKQIEDGLNERRELILSTTKRIDSFIKEWLGNDWGCGLVGNSGIEIGMVEYVAENKANHFYFGHTFTLYYNDYFQKDRFEMNYGCMGSFGLLNGSKESDLRCQYLLGMGKFSTDKEKLTELKNILVSFCKKEYEYSQTLDALRHNLKHPFDKKKVA